MTPLTVTVLDHGSVTLRNISGPTRRAIRMAESIYDDGTPRYTEAPRAFDADDVDPAQAARMSFDQMDGDRTAAQDHKLAEYLMRNWHTSPFEMVEIWLEMKLPIFVARQFVRHRTVSINEVSGRYVTLPDEWYIPDTVGSAPKDKKQGQGNELTSDEQLFFKRALTRHCKSGYVDYLMAIDNGVAPEHARLFLSLNHYTHWLWKQDLHNMMHFLSLRSHDHAQLEARIYAHAIIELLREQLPKSMDLFDKYRRRV